MDAPFPDTMMPDIERFFAECHVTQFGHRKWCHTHAIDDVFKFNGFFPLQRKRELTWMMQKVAEMLVPTRQDDTAKLLTYMEIGADKAGGLYHWCQFPNVNRVIACEVRGTPYSREFERAFPDVDFLWLPRSSYDQQTLEMVDHYLMEQRTPIDVLFIDGDKSHFLTDFELYSPLVNNDGVIFVHDVRDPGPREAFETIKEMGYTTDVFVDESEAHEVMQRHLSGYEPRDAYEQWLLHWKGSSCGVGVIYPGPQPKLKIKAA